MNPKHVMVRMDRETGELWLTEERFRKPIKKVANITSHVLLALAADLVAEDRTQNVTRDIRFSDGQAIRITIEDIGHEDQGSEGSGEVDHS